MNVTSPDVPIGPFLTPAEKVMQLEQLEELIREGDIDPEAIPHITALNQVEGVVTSACCAGHSRKTKRRSKNTRIVERGYIELRVTPETVDHVESAFYMLTSEDKAYCTQRWLHVEGGDQTTPLFIYTAEFERGGMEEVTRVLLLNLREESPIVRPWRSVFLEGGSK